MLEIMKASAGSGKTWNLAKKYIGLLLKSDDRYAYRHILAVTFTNKATDEMKSRILKELHLLAVSPSESGFRDVFVPSLFESDAELCRKARTVLHDMLHDYSAFAVSTIDKFFQQTLKAFSREIGQFASYQVELDKDSLVAESVDRILDSLTEDDDSLLAWLTSNVLEQIEQGGRYSLDANLLDMAKRLKSPQRQEVLEREGIDEEKICSKDHLVEVRKRCRELTGNFREQVRHKAEQALQVLEQAGVNPADSSYGFMTQLYDYAELKEGMTVACPKDTFMKRAPYHEKWFPAKKAKTLLPLVHPFLDAPLQDIVDLFDKDFAVYNTACILDSQLYGLGVAGELNRTFRELMKEKNVLCIDDSNTLLRDIIDGSDAPFVYEKLGVRYEHFLLDEFQDTAGVQWMNFSPLLHNSDSQGGENLIVGDVKQSIYRWRGSDWKLLDATVPAEFSAHQQTVLDTNWRSLSNIVSFNNGFFEAAAEVLDAIGGHAQDGPLAKIYADVRQKVAAKDKQPGYVSLTFCDKDRQLEEVLASVSEALASGARLSEVAVLVRSNAIGEAVASYLIDNGVPVITDDSLKVKGALTVRRLVSLMSYMDNPEDTVNSFLAESLSVTPPKSSSSLVDMAESLLRSIKRSDPEGLWKGEVLHIQSFVDHLQDYVSMNGNSLRGFLKWWDGEDPSISSPSSGESVRVMTIHKSKGLDFPYVIIPFVENISLYKPDSSWCVPRLEGTSLEGVAEGVYDVRLSSSSEASLFAEDYRNETFLQYVDNINTLYVAMTRAAWRMHIISKSPPASCVSAVSEGRTPVFKDFSQILYWYASAVSEDGGFRKTVEEDVTRFDVGCIDDCSVLRKNVSDAGAFETAGDDPYPSFPLNPVSEDTGADVRERGRLKFSADSIDYFKDDAAGISASNRIRGVVLHDILSRVYLPSDLGHAVRQSVDDGELSSVEEEEVLELLSGRIREVESRGWFPDNPEKVLNEVELIDVDGKIYRPDRVVVSGGKVVVVDYKFGESKRSYERQIAGYADLWRRMGYEDVSASLWYVQTGEVVDVLPRR